MLRLNRLTSGSCLCALVLIGCTNDGGLLVGNLGVTPSADARVLGHEAKEVMLEFTGEPLEVRLDGSHSTDMDGRIVRYRWLSGTRAARAADGGDPGPNRAVPEGESANWPDDVERPVVTLREGEYVFTLWVTDDRGNISTPDSVHLTVSPPLDASTQACVAGTAPKANRSCAQCICGVSDECRGVVSASACNDTCWSLIACIGQNCPGFMPGGDTSCLTSKCTQFLGAGAAARALTPCIDACSDACRSTP